VEIYNYIDRSKVLNREIDRFAYARDASIYRLLPEIVVRPKDETDIRSLFKYAKEYNKSITFRASGTSLSGQTVTDGIIAEIAYDWQNIIVKNDGKSIILEPGVIGEHANQRLRKFQRRIGPDPASLKAARIGGILANNASGGSTGKPYNSYNTLKYLRFILPNGNIYDSSNKNDYSKFLENEQKLATELIKIRKKIHKRIALKNKIIEKYRLKNTIGYGLNSFIDFEHPLDIFAHLLIGSEGTLAFIANVELETIPDPPYKSTALAIFPNIKYACNAIDGINNCGVSALELMDYASLITAKYVSDAPYKSTSLSKNSAALLCEFQEDNPKIFNELEINLTEIIKQYNGSLIGNFARDEFTRTKLWKIRKSLFATVGSMRKPGTSIITEDICFDIGNLSAAITDLHGILAKWKYSDAVIFGHAKDGNIHFNLSLDLESKSGIENYREMMNEIADITIDKYNGSLKAEHGTGRNMAPFIEKEWGTELYQVMWEIKQLVDPNNILSPNVLLSDNRKIHIENLKPMPNVHDKIDLCVECGFCEPVCPSRGFTLTPRQRIGVARELKMLEANGSVLSKKLINDSKFNVNTTCAVDGMCEAVCPININTGEYVKVVRSQEIGKLGKNIANWISSSFTIVSNIISFAIKSLIFVQKIFGSSLMNRCFNLINKLSNQRIPAWNSMITNSIKLPKLTPIGTGRTYIYYPSCISRTFSANRKAESIFEILEEIATKTDVKLIIPKKIETTCCSTLFSSKGYISTAKDMFEKTINLLYTETKSGKYPVMVDTSPCTYKFMHPEDEISDEIKNKWKSLKFIDIIPFLNDCIENTDYKPLDQEVVLHSTCSTQKLEQLQDMRALAKKCAKKVVVPENSNCCAFAGDRGLLVPQLAQNAVKMTKNQLSIEQQKLNGYSSSRMCEIGMSTKQQTYGSIALLVRDYLRQS